MEHCEHWDCTVIKTLAEVIKELSSPDSFLSKSTHGIFSVQRGAFKGFRSKLPLGSTK